MKIQIKYQSKIKISHVVEPTIEKHFIEMGEMFDDEANLSHFFNSQIDGFYIIDKGVQFEYNQQNKQLYCSVVFECRSKPTDKHLEQLVSETTNQLDCGYYGDDGWFVDIGKNSYYIDLIDQSLLNVSPTVVILDE